MLEGPDLPLGSILFLGARRPNGSVGSRFSTLFCSSTMIAWVRTSLSGKILSYIHTAV